MCSGDRHDDTQLGHAPSGSRGGLDPATTGQDGDHAHHGHAHHSHGHHAHHGHGSAPWVLHHDQGQASDAVAGWSNTPDHAPQAAGPASPADTAHDPAAVQGAPGDHLGWGDAAWGEAGGFEAVLVGHLFGAAEAAGAGAGGGGAPIVVFAIDHLDIGSLTLIENTMVENNSVLLNAGNGGTIDVAGSINALSSQTAFLDHPTGLADLQHHA